MTLVTRIVRPVLAATTLGGSTLYTHADSQFDYAINGMPFLSAVDANHPMVRKTAPYRKQTQDNGTEPGEQSLGFWWIKAQSTFHGGAGQTYIDTPVPQGAEVRPIRYNLSAGVNPWVQGRLSMLPTTSKAATVAGAAPTMISVTTGSLNYLMYSDGAALWRVQETVSAGTPTYSAPTSVSYAGGTVQSLVTDGTLWYATDGAGVYRGDFTTPAVAAVKIYNMTSGTAMLAWVKQRLMLGYTTSTAASVFELNNQAGAGTALPTAKFAHPNIAWRWTCFTSGPNAIYIGGYAGALSTVYKFVLDSNGVTPTLTTGLMTAELPPGELLYAMTTYLGTCIALATSRGLRVAFFDNASTTGDFTYGPLSVTTAATTGAVTGFDRFLYYSYTDSSGVAGVARVDLSQQLTIRAFSYTPDQRFSWAPDLRATDNAENFVTGTTVAVGQIAGRLCFAVGSQGIFVEHPTVLTPSAYLVTSRIRYDTLDPKIVRYVRIRTDGSKGTVTAAVQANADNAGTVAATVVSSQGNDSTDQPVYLGELQFATVYFTFSREATDLTSGGVLVGYQLKALPAQKRQRFIQIPLKCFDVESDASGQIVVFPSYINARQRLLALEALESTGDVVTLQMLSPYPDNEYSTLCVIEDIEYQQTSAPTERQGWGGIINLTVRTVDS